MKHDFLDRFRAGDSLVHRLDPRLKLLATLAFVIALGLASGRDLVAQRALWPAYAGFAALAWGAVLVSRAPLAVALRRSAIALPFAGMVALAVPFTQAGQPVWSGRLLGLPLTVTDAGLALFGSVVVRAWLAVVVAGLMVATTPLTDLLRALRALRVPAVLVSVISFMYRYLFVLTDEAMRLQLARAARSADPTGRGGGSLAWRARVLGGMIGSLFIRAYERSERVYAAMLSRGYRGEIRCLRRLAWQPRDTWAAVGWGAALGAFTLLARLI